MDKENIIRMAREAGLADSNGVVHAFYQLERFAFLIAEHERNACSELVLQGTGEPVQTKTLEILRKERERVAAAIRAKGQL